MKTQNLLISILIILLLFFACKEKPNDPDYASVQMNFIVTDSLGKDLFFDAESPYNPYDVKIDTTTLSSRAWNLKTVRDTNCFYIGGFYVAGNNLPKREIHIRFFPGRTDTLTIDECDNGQSSPSYDFNAFFNSDTICIKCDRGKIYQITTDIPSKNHPNE